MSPRQVRLSETLEAIGGPIARLRRSLGDDRGSVLKNDASKNAHDLLATDAFLQRFQQVADLTLRKLFPRLLSVLEQSDVRHPFGTVLDRLEGYEIIADAQRWIALNDMRNRLIHEYAMDADDRLRELTFAWDAAEIFCSEVLRLRDDRELGGRLFK